MGYDYALVHLTYTIPPAILLTAVYFPLFTKLDIYKLIFLITIAVVSTIPWDSYLIRTGVWSYPPNVIVGPTLYDIPLEEVFFFVIQTYNTTLLYLLLSKPVVKETYLVREDQADKRTRHWKYVKLLGQLGLGLALRYGIQFVRDEGPKTYLGLILIWALPFVLLLWSLAYQFIIGLPLYTTALPIALPTFYLWIVDTLALKRGTWVISSGTKTGWELWPSLEIEEAIFFLLTNTLIVFGLLAFDNAVAVLNAFPVHFPQVPALPSPVLLIRALLLPSKTYDDDRILGLRQAVVRLSKKSRSFYLASSTFSGRLRIDLILLYSFCRVADDLIDNAPSTAHAREHLAKLRHFLDLAYSKPEVLTRPKPKSKSRSKKATDDKSEEKESEVDTITISPMDMNRGAATIYVVQNFPADKQLALLLLPVDRLDREPLDELLNGFDMDLKFEDGGDSATPAKGSKSRKSATAKPTTTSSTRTASASGPITSVKSLDLYASRVAGTVALLCIQLVLYHHDSTPSSFASPAEEDAYRRESIAKAKRILGAGHDMGIALQYTNIARDIAVDAAQGRCYVPLEWLEDGLTAKEFIAAVCTEKQSANDGDAAKTENAISKVRERLLERAWMFYEKSIDAVDELPAPARNPMRVACESYMQIARELGKKGYVVKKGRATVPLWRRVWVGWSGMAGVRRARS